MKCPRPVWRIPKRHSHLYIGGLFDDEDFCTSVSSDIAVDVVDWWYLGTGRSLTGTTVSNFALQLCVSNHLKVFFNVVVYIGICK